MWLDTSSPKTTRNGKYICLNKESGIIGTELPFLTYYCVFQEKNVIYHVQADPRARGLFETLTSFQML